MIQIKKTILTLVALLAVTTGAWAQTESLLVTINSKGNNSFKSGNMTFDDIATITFSGTVHNDNDNYGWYWYNPGSGTSVTMSVTPAEGYTITKVKFYCSEGSAFDETAPFEARLDGSGPETYVNGISIGHIGVNKIEVYGYATPAATAAIELTPDATRKVWTLDKMPGGNVELEPEYYDLATLATNGVTAPTYYVWAKTEDPLAIVADGAVTGGTLMFAFGTETTYPDLDGDDWQTAIPTAENLDGAGGTTYVWFYIKGDDEHSDSEPQRLTINVQPEHEYTVSMAEGTDDAANWKAGKNDASPTTLPLEGVKKGDKVTVKYDGERKVIGMKAENVVKIKTFSIQGPSGNVSPGQTITFTIINIQPAEATNQTFEWKLVSGTPEGTTIESISDDTKTVTVKAGSSMGPITIRATAKDGSGYSNTKQVWLIP